MQRNFLIFVQNHSELKENHRVIYIFLLLLDNNNQNHVHNNCNCCPQVISVLHTMTFNIIIKKKNHQIRTQNNNIKKV